MQIMDPKIQKSRRSCDYNLAICMLASGSKGNATYISDGDTSILLDAGLSGVELERRLISRNLVPEQLDAIIVKGAREHNLKDIHISLPKKKLIVFTGVSGSGKSSLALDTIFAEGQRRYVESLSAYARQFIGQMEKPNVEFIEGLSPAISIDQKTASRNPRSTVGTVTEI